MLLILLLFKNYSDVRPESVRYRKGHEYFIWDLALICCFLLKGVENETSRQ